MRLATSVRATAHYRNEAGSPTALRFAEAVRDTLMAIIGRPGIGSPRYAGPLNLLGLRSHPTRRFPYLVFYVERPDRIEVWRVLHAQRDIPAYFSEAGASS
jgi:toxin ParE1/3/4